MIDRSRAEAMAGGKTSVPGADDDGGDALDSPVLFVLVKGDDPPLTLEKAR